MKRLKLNWAKSLAFGLLLIAAGCKKDKKMVLVPELTTTAFTAVDNTTGASGGTVTSDGGAELTEVGVFYSKTNPTPGSSDTKLTGSLTGGAFTVQLTGLSTGSTYYIRAYATNSAGTGYGQVLSFMTGNSAPVATEVKINGEIGIGKELTAAYTYSDSENDPQNGTTFQWYSATDAAGAGEAAITGATASTYTTVAADEFKFIRVGVTPKSSAGTTAGVEVKSAFVGPLPEAGETVTFMYNGKSVTYGVIESPVTHRKWLDRNLGAPNAPTSLTDYENFGDLFQWGRQADGHQLITWASGSASTGTNGITTTKFNTTTTDNALFVTTNSEPYYWTTGMNDHLWDIGSANNPCPDGWHIPTKLEWEAEIASNAMSTSQEAFNKLKLTYSGYRDPNNGKISTPGLQGYYWSSTTAFDAVGYEYYVRIFYLDSSGASIGADVRSNGDAVRCIKNP